MMNRTWLATLLRALRRFGRWLRINLAYVFLLPPERQDLLDLVATVDPAIAEALRPSSVLSRYAVEVRYPGHFPELTVDELREAVRLAPEVRAAIRSALGLG